MDFDVPSYLLGKSKGSGGTSDYSDLSNKPSINSVELSGNKTSSDLGIQSEIDSTHKLGADLVDDTNTTNKFVTASDKTTWSGKQDALVSGTNIKTINNQSILGSGDITISGGGDINIKAYYYPGSSVNFDLSNDNLEKGVYINPRNPSFNLKIKGLDGVTDSRSSAFSMFYITKKYSEVVNDEVFLISYTGTGNIRYYVKKTSYPSGFGIEEYTADVVNKDYVDDKPTTYAGYDATKTQVLKNVNGTLTWVDE